MKKIFKKVWNEAKKKGSKYFKSKGWIFYIFLVVVFFIVCNQLARCAGNKIQKTFGSSKTRVVEVQKTSRPPKTLTAPTSGSGVEKPKVKKEELPKGKTSPGPKVQTPQVNKHPQGVYTTPVREYTPQAQWVASAKMFRDVGGYFITPPDVSIQGKVRFNEFAQAHPDQANRIIARGGR